MRTLSMLLVMGCSVVTEGCLRMVPGVSPVVRPPPRPPTTAAPATTTPDPCPERAGEVSMFIANDVPLSSAGYGASTPSAPCKTCASGSVKYWMPSTSDTPNTNSMDAAGSISNSMCSNMCICTDTTCYTADPGTSPILWPYCSDGACAMYVYLTSGQLNGQDQTVVTADSQVNPDTFDPYPVTMMDVYPKATQVSCGGCPISAC